MEIKKEIDNVKREYHANKLKKVEEKAEEKKQEEEKSAVFKEYQQDYEKYKDRKKTLPVKGSGREEFTLDLLKNFKRKLQSAKEKEGEPEPQHLEEADEDDDDENW